jgi:hypothetical protein
MAAKLSPAVKKRLIKKYGHVPTKKEVFQKIQESQDRLMAALKGAYENMPEDPGLREQFLDALEQAAKLNKGIKQVIKEKK